MARGCRQYDGGQGDENCCATVRRRFPLVKPETPGFFAVDNLFFANFSFFFKLNGRKFKLIQIPNGVAGLGQTLVECAVESASMDEIPSRAYASASDNPVQVERPSGTQVLQLCRRLRDESTFSQGRQWRAGGDVWHKSGQSGPPGAAEHAASVSILLLPLLPAHMAAGAFEEGRARRISALPANRTPDACQGILLPW